MIYFGLVYELTKVKGSEFCIRRLNRGQIAIAALSKVWQLCKWKIILPVEPSASPDVLEL